MNFEVLLIVVQQLISAFNQGKYPMAHNSIGLTEYFLFFCVICYAIVFNQMNGHDLGQA